MKNFVKYAQYYNILYGDKGYKKETDYISRLIKRYSRGPVKTILDVGCGTGNHDIWFAKKGYRVTGMDRSREMLAIARNKFPAGKGISFKICDVLKFDLHRRFDIAVSLFHVMSYLTTDKALLRGLKNIRKHLKMDGLFIFDFWYGPAVLVQNPSRKVKTVSDGDIDITRVAVPIIDLIQKTVDINYKITVLDKNMGSTKAIAETHKMRYFFLPELKTMLEQAGFELVRSLEWLSADKSLGPESWSGLIIARKDQES